MSLTIIRLTFVIWFIGLVSLTGCSAPPAPPPPDPLAWSEVLSLLPPDGATIEVLDLVPSSRHTELAKKFEDARANDPEWFRAHVLKRKTGERLAYDPKVGMSQAEYEELIDLGSKAKYVKVKTATLQVRREGSIIRFDGGTDLLHLTPVKLDLEADSVTTPFGTAAARSRIAANEEQVASGPWNGILWKLLESSPNVGQGTAVQFGLGKLKETGKGILYYDVRKNDGAMKNRASYVLRYELPTTP